MRDIIDRHTIGPWAYRPKATRRGGGPVVSGSRRSPPIRYPLHNTRRRVGIDPLSCRIDDRKDRNTIDPGWPESIPYDTSPVGYRAISASYFALQFPATDDIFHIRFIRYGRYDSPLPLRISDIGRNL